MKTLRWHTRLPVADPDRVTAAMARALRADGQTVVVALHANHPRELTVAARAACRRLSAQGLMLLSQSVLLKGVNDEVETLDALMRAFVEAGVKPYYLHHGDLAPGTAHWRVPIAKGQELMRSLRARLSGLAMPTYVLDIPGGRGKSRSDLNRSARTAPYAMSLPTSRASSTFTSTASPIDSARRPPARLMNGSAASPRPSGAAAGCRPGPEWRNSAHMRSAPPSAW